MVKHAQPLRLVAPRQQCPRRTVPVSLGWLALATAVVVLAYQPDTGTLGANLPQRDATTRAFGARLVQQSLIPGNLSPFTDQPWDRLVGNDWNYLKRGNSKDADIVVDTT